MMPEKIAIIASSLHPIKQRHLLDWFDDLSHEDFKIQFFLGSKIESIPAAKNYKVNTKPDKLKYAFSNLVFKKRLEGLKKIQPLVNYAPRIIHLLTSNAFVHIEPILQDKHIKLIVSFRGFDLNVFPFQSIENKRTTERIFLRADVLHFISEDLKNTAIELGAEPKKCKIIYRSIQDSPIENINKHRATNKKLIILTVGRLVWEKGYLYALETMAILKENGYDFEYQIAGEGPDHNMLRFHLGRLGLMDKVTFLGQISPDEVKRRMLQSNIYFQPSLTEALSVSIIEASFHGLPVVSSKIGGIPEVVGNNVTGFLSDICKPEEFAKNIIKLLIDKKLRVQMGMAGREQILSKFSRNREIEVWKDIYNHFLTD